jgi:hypothetical protein
VDITRLSYWFPKLQSAGLPVPCTTIIKATAPEYKALYNLLDGKEPGKAGKALIERVKAAADEMGYPCFLRTDHTSGKHNWEKTCYLGNPDKVQDHIGEIIMFWECVNMFAPPCDVWVVREFLPTMPVGVCRGYGNMPICREFRFFVDGPEVKCWHPYWPLDALEQGDPLYNHENFDYEEFCRTPDIEHITGLASAAGKAVGGEWSVDILETSRGWFITDMAEAHKSYHQSHKTED